MSVETLVDPTHNGRFCAFVHRVCLGTLLRLAARLIGPLLPVPPARITTRVAPRWVLDHG